MKLLKCAAVLSLLLYSSFANGQSFSYKEHPFKLSDPRLSEKNYKLSEANATSVSGIFLSPSIGASFPLRDFRNNSKTGLLWGLKLEFASSKIYPFIIGAVYDRQSHEGNDEFKATNFLGTFKTSISSFGGSIDILLNKYIKSNFTTPFLTLDVRFMNIEREVLPAENNPGLLLTESITAFSGGAGFTIFIFDIIGTFTYAKSFSSINLKTRFHFPVVKF